MSDIENKSVETPLASANEMPSTTLAAPTLTSATTPDKDSDAPTPPEAPKGFLGDQAAKIKHEFKQYRQAVILAAPETLVNHSSNLIGALQISSEMLMFKANGTKFMSPLSPNDTMQWHSYVSRPLGNIWKGVSQGFKGEINPKALLSPRAWYNTVTEFVNPEKATAVQRLSGKPFVNYWQARSTFFGLAGMGVAAFLPDHQESPEETEKMATLRHSNPIAYAGTRLWQSVYLPGWFNGNKREFIGLGLTLAGTCSALSGFRNVREVIPGVESSKEYFINKAHAIGGTISALAGSQLLMAIDSDQGWSRFGSTMWARFLFLPSSISARYAKGDPAANWYTLGQVGLQTTNTTAALLGGAEKHNGIIVDHETMRNEVVKNARAAQEEVRHAKELKKLAPQSADARPENGHMERSEEEAPATPPTPKIQQAALQARLIEPSGMAVANG